ncbi:hypothetical protein [Candidatus Tisiphia endosymbiont of Nemotelus uliginosus]|uniref:hypothetical protein n=1 Tax=Candidatus Tisiphia endosymbiont of Nemotelus uliginosus TaxID=3077926 RepID=UPI0035C8E240
MPTNPYELISSITEVDINGVPTVTPDEYSDTESRSAVMDVAQYIRMLQLAPTFLNFIKNSIYIHTTKYSADYTYTTIITQPYQVTSDTVTYKTLNDKDEIIEVIVDSEVIEKIRAAREWENTSKICLHTIENFFKETINSEKLKILKPLVQPGLVSEQEWEAALTLITKYKIVEDYIHPHVESRNTKISEDATIHEVIVAAHKIEEIVSDHDVVIFAGNTPQLIRYPFEKIITNTKPNIKTVSLAISGHPGQIKTHYVHGILANILTPESHDIYKEYMQHMGITKEYVKDHKIYLIDCIGSGGGIAYLVRCITEIADANDVRAPYDATKSIEVIALNKVDPVYAKFSCEIKHHDLKMNTLTKTLDRVSDDESSLRLMPSASSYKWTHEFIQQMEEHSQHIFDNLNTLFVEVFDKIDREMMGQSADVIT